MTPQIQQPQNATFKTKGGKTSLEWSTRFRGRWQARYSSAQKFVDSEVLRLSEPFIPLQTGMLIHSGILGTDVGSGLVMWIAPYAKAQYYRPRRIGSETGPLRGPFWFERMKDTHGSRIISGARRIAGRP